MPDSTQQPQHQPTPHTRTPQPNRILAQPATVAACQADYANAADIRQRLHDQLRGR